jgi:hypothetical protein
MSAAELDCRPADLLTRVGTVQEAADDLADLLEHPHPRA